MKVLENLSFITKEEDTTFVWTFSWIQNPYFTLEADLEKPHFNLEAECHWFVEDGNFNSPGDFLFRKKFA